MMTHQPTDHELLTALALGELDSGAEHALRQRLEAEPDLARAFEHIRAAVGFLRDEPGAEPSPAALRAAKKLLRQSRPGLLDTLADGLRQVVAALDFDSRLTPAIAGIRGAAASAQVAFSCDEAEIDLEISPAGDDQWLVNGQIDADEAGDWQVTIVDSARNAPDITIDAIDGAFRTRLAPGAYELALRRGDLIVRVSPLTIP